MSDEMRERVARAIQRPPMMQLTSQDLRAADAAIAALAPELAASAAMRECVKRGWEMLIVPLSGSRVTVNVRSLVYGDMTGASGDELPTVLAEAMSKARARWG